MPTVRPAANYDAICTWIGNAPLDQVAASEIMHVFALSGHDPGLMLAALSGTKIATGTGSLVDAIASQATLADMRLGSTVGRVVQAANGVRVELAGGEAIRRARR